MRDVTKQRDKGKLKLSGIALAIITGMLFAIGYAQPPPPPEIPPMLLWKYETGGPIFSSPIIADIDGNDTNEVLVASQDFIHIINADGSLKSQFKTETPVIFSSPPMGENEVFVVGSEDSCLYSLRFDGSINRVSPGLGGPVIFSFPGMGENEVFVVGSEDSCLYALKFDGSIDWESPKLGGPIRSSPTIGDLDSDGTNEIYVGSQDSCIYSLSLEDGSVNWKFKIDGPVLFSAPAIGDLDNDGINELYIGSCDGCLYAIIKPGIR